MPCLRPARQQPNRQRISPRRQPATNHSLLLRKCVGNLKHTEGGNLTHAASQLAQGTASQGPALDGRQGMRRDGTPLSRHAAGLRLHLALQLPPRSCCTWPSSSRHAAAAPGPPAPATQLLHLALQLPPAAATALPAMLSAPAGVAPQADGPAAALTDHQRTPAQRRTRTPPQVWLRPQPQRLVSGGGESGRVSSGV
jgi:hypothetical protein